MKKLLGISLVAVLAANPMMAFAGNDDPDPATVIATTSYVQGAYDALDERVGVDTTLDEGFGVDATLTSAVNTLKGDIDTAYAAAQGSVQSVGEGATNGTISVDGTPVAVHGLGTAAFEDASAFASAAQGALADTAVQSITEGSTNGTINVDGTDVRVNGLGTAAYASNSDFADQDLSNLSNTGKANLSAAGTVDTSGNTQYANNTIGKMIVDANTAISQRATDIGTLSNLSTTAKSSLVAAVNELNSDKADKDLSNLSNTGKANVSALGTVDLNEHYNGNTIGSVLVDTNTNITNVQNAIGTISNLAVNDASGNATDNLVEAVNAVNSKGIMIADTWQGSPTFHAIGYDTSSN